jgi:hypothetical protein
VLRGSEIDTKLGAQFVQWFSGEWGVVHVSGLRASLAWKRGEGVVTHDVDVVLREHCTFIFQQGSSFG